MPHTTDWDNMEWDEELGEFVQKKDDSASGDDTVETKDSNGTVLQNGDFVLLTKDLDVKGSSLNLKRGTKVKIKLVGDPDNIECKQGKSTLVLKTCFLKKA
jgi:protein PhnA